MDSSQQNLIGQQTQDEVDEDVFVFPTTFGQQRFWFLDLFEPGSPYYNIPMAVRISGKLRIDILEKCINEIVRRHESLRTTFTTLDNSPVQVISQYLYIPIRYTNLTKLPENDRGSESLKLALEEARGSFNLRRGPLLRVHVICVNHEEYVVLFTMHHIISDGWSMSVLIRELFILYEAFSDNLPSPLPELELQYADYANWQREWLKEDVLQNQLNYWRDKLSDALPVLELPFDRPRPAIQTNHGSSFEKKIPLSLLNKLKNVSQEESATLFMTLLAAFKILLYRYSNQEDICIGTPIANRTRIEIEQLIGLFINTLVIRTNFQDSLTFKEVLYKVREASLGAYAHQDVPFESIVDMLQPERDMSHSPLFQVMFILQNANIQGQLSEFSYLKIEQLDIDSGTATFDLTLSITEQRDGLDVSVEFNTDLFNKQSIVRILNHYEVLMAGIVDNSEQLIGLLPLLTSEEQRILVWEWNLTHVDYLQQHVLFQHVFEEQVNLVPESIAVVSPIVGKSSQSMTYRELNRHANILANYLRKIGVGPETIVGVCVQKSLEMVVGIIAVMKAGGAYLPIDPMYPKERLSFIIDDSDIEYIILQEKLVPNFHLKRLKMILIDKDWPNIVLESGTEGEKNPDCISKPIDLAYMIYTSGSTGQAKGVMVEHRNLINAFLAWNQEYKLPLLKSYLQMANFSFDVFTGDFVRALGSGGKLVLCPRDYLLSPQLLYELIKSEKIDCAEFVPAVLRSLIQYIEKNNLNLSFIDLLICGSDSWYAEEYKRFLKYCGKQTRLVNSFGLTETTIDSTFFEAKSIELMGEQVVPIGRPFPNTQIYILDKNSQPVPIGVKGELYIGGAGVARGYYKRPDLTADKFIPFPLKNEEFSSLSKNRLYKTGDVTRYLPDGNVEFLGRLDYQVKIRGFRVETGEIEAVLREFPGIKDALVVSINIKHEPEISLSNNQRLVGYIVVENCLDRLPWPGDCLVWEYGDKNPDWENPLAIRLGTINVSENGVCLFSVPDHWRKGQKLSLNLNFPDEVNPFLCIGMIAWIHDGLAGIRFELFPSQKAVLLRIMKKIASMPGHLMSDSSGGGLRIFAHGKVEIRTSEGLYIQANLESMSTSGVRVSIISDKELVRQLTKKSRIQLTIFLQEYGIDEIRDITGNITWISEGQIGISIDLKDRDLDVIKDIIRVAIDQQEISIKNLRIFMKNKLPDYMVPSAFVLMEELPLTPNGKIDRQSLPSPDWTNREIEGEFILPRTPVEEVLSGIWTLLLGVDKIGINDNFFELGGHSLLATQVISRIRESFNIDLPLRNIFETPTIRGLAEQIDSAQQQNSGISTPPIQVISRDRELPLSFAQQRLWFLDQLEPESAFYNLPESIRLFGSLESSVLERCANEVIRRHESLRTTFISKDGVPYQNILPNLEIQIPLIDLSLHQIDKRESMALEISRQEAGTPFNLTTGPLFRIKLIQISENDHIVLITMHHIIGDNWSSNILVFELTTLYNAFINNHPSPLPPLAIQYVDYSYWQRNWLKGDILDRQIGYWKDQLKNSPPILELPLDHPRPPIQSFTGDYKIFTLPLQLSKELKNLCQKEGVTMFMLLLAAFQVLLFRYSGQEDFNIGTPIANRHRFDIEKLIGFFVNTLVIRSQFFDEPNFQTHLHRVREATLGAYAHQDLPFEMIVDALHPERNLSQSPLFQVMFVIQNSILAPERSGELKIQPYSVHSGTSKFDLTLFLDVNDDSISGAFEYNLDIFVPNTLDRMIDHFITLLKSIVSSPDIPITKLPILKENEYQLIVNEWNSTCYDFPRYACVHNLFENQVTLTKGAIAVQFQDQILTYSELNQRSNQVAHFLIKHGVTPETLIGICVERSLDMVIGILGILKSGGAYVPLDPTYPLDRLKYMIEDSGMRIVLTQSGIVERLNFGNLDQSIYFLKMDETSDLFSREEIYNPVTDVTSENLAYVIYTSGSTGRPKGAMILHRGLVNYLTWCKLGYPVDEGIGSPVHSSISFDLTITSLFSPLVSGKKVLLLPEDTGVETLGEILRQKGDFSLVKITPAHLQLVGQQLSPNEAQGRTHAFIIGGENMTSDHIHFWKSNSPGTKLINEYGPTETVVGCCVYTVTADDITKGVLPIGKPIINTELYIVDKYLQPVPIGVHGELCIGGEGVARGYLHQPELTKEKFVPNPFSKSLGSKIYRTGDLARFLPDGTIECLGRIDFQVKIRGFRVELGEIENVLSRNPQIKEAVVWTRDEEGIKRLVAYFVPLSKENVPTQSALKEYLKESLPEYMIPSFFVTLDELPLTANGKVDRKALPIPVTTEFELNLGYIAPRSRVEEILVKIWENVLGVSHIGIHDNFFDLGGDSILSIQIIVRANQEGLGLTPRLLFENPTIAGLGSVSNSSRLINAEQGMVAGDYPLTSIQTWFFDLNLLKPDHWNQSIFLSPPFRLDESIIEKTLCKLIHHHDSLRTRFIPYPGKIGCWKAEIQSFSENGGLPFQYHKLDEVDLSEKNFFIEEMTNQAQKSLNISTGPILKMLYFSDGQNDPGKLFITIHHLVMDAISWRILLEDFQSIYSAIKRGAVPELPMKTSSFKDWARKLEDFANSIEIIEQLDNWKNKPDEFAVKLPVDNEFGQNIESSSKSINVTLEPETTRALLQDVSSTFKTEIIDSLITALACTISTWTNSSIVSIDVESHGREDLFSDLDISRTIGWFTNIYPLRLRIKNLLDHVGTNLLDVKEQIRSIPMKGLGYGLLKYVNRTLSENLKKEMMPFSEILFNYLGQMDQGSSPQESLHPVSENNGLDRDPLSKRTHLIDINGAISGGTLQFEWTYSNQIFNETTIQNLADLFIVKLREIVAFSHTSEIESESYKDFGWDDGDLGDIISALGKIQ